MDQNYQLVITLASISLIYSFIFFYIYKQSKHKYIAIWGFGWMIYSLGYLLDLFTFAGPFSVILKDFLSIVSSFFLLLGTFEFVGSKFSRMFISISIVFSAVIMVFSLMLYNTDSVRYLSDQLTLTASVLLSVISVGTGIAFLTHEERSQESILSGNKRDITIDITAWLFIIWGMHKGFYNFVTPDYAVSPWNYISSIFLTNVLNIALILVNSAKSNSEITSSERLYRLLAENSRDAIMKINLFPMQCCIYVSPAIHAITGYQEKNFYQRPDFFIGIVDEQDRARYSEYVKNIRQLDSKITFRLRRQDNKVIWIEQHSTFVYDEYGSPSSIEAILRDISDRMQIEESLFNSEIARRQLLANISHELKNPITSIIGYLSVIGDNLISSPETYLKYVKICLEKSLTLNSLIQDLFELSKLEAKQLPFQWEKTNAAEYIQDTYLKYKIDIEKAGVRSRLTGFENPGEDLYISIDKRRFDQVLHNIVSNALNNIDKDGEILFHFNQQDGFSRSEVEQNRASYILLSIEDNGVGIPEADLSLIFQRFYKSPSSAANGGTGLGLSISKEIINMHQGIIWAESQVDKRTTIFIALPKLEKECLLQK